MGLPGVPGDWGEGDEDSDSKHIPLLLIPARGTSLEFYVQCLPSLTGEQTGTPRLISFVLPEVQTHQEDTCQQLSSHLPLSTFFLSSGMQVPTPLPCPRGRKTALQSSTKPAWQAQDARSQQPFLLDFLLTGILSLLCLTGAFLPWAFPSFFSLDQVLESWVSWELVDILIVCDSWEHLCSLTLSFRRKRQPLDT